MGSQQNSAKLGLADRLKAARLRAGFESGAAAASRLNIPYGTYSGHESGSRGVKDADLRRYANLFEVPLSWLRYGEGQTPDHIVISQTGSLLARMQREKDAISQQINDLKQRLASAEAELKVVSKSIIDLQETKSN